VTLLVIGAAFVAGCRERRAAAGAPIQGRTQDMGVMTVARLIEGLRSAHGLTRVAASAELLRRGNDVRIDLERAGAKPIAGLSPARLDALYTLMTGASVAPHRSDSIGLLVEPGTTAAQVQEMGRRCGFSLGPGVGVRADAAPSCYVRVHPGRSLERVMSDVLRTEASVVSVTYNFTEEGVGR
jgi:hypothetical protein